MKITMLEILILNQMKEVWHLDLEKVILKIYYQRMYLNNY